MQHGALWKLADRLARLEFAGLAATVDLTRPELGLTDFAFHGRSFPRGPPRSHMLGVCLPRASAAGPPIADAYVRHDDLVVTYAQTPGLPVRVQIYWRAAAGPADTPAVDLQVSVQTSLLDSCPQLMTSTSLDAAEMLALEGGSGSEFKTVNQAAAANVQARSLDCLLFRLPGGAMSYAEMIHPADAGGGSLFVAAEAGQENSATSVSHHLFAASLEKGVILRARLRGLFLPRQRDAQLAADAYRQFLAAPPPLAT